MTGYASILNEALRFWWVIPTLLLFSALKTPWFKGWLGESLVKFAAWLRLPADTYHAFHNITLPTPEGTTQIDHIFVSRFGIFVVETKNMNGWIFGGQHQPRWTQKLFRKSFQFQNPLRQNHKHTKALEEALDVPSQAIHSVIVFAGNSTFRTPMPHNVTRGGGFITHIKSFEQPILSESDVREAMKRIQAGRLEPCRETHRQHVRQLKRRTDPSTQRRCPECGSSMVLRTARRGENAGKKFWGCSAYPKCRVVQTVT